MEKERVKKSWGGPRPGAGRKPVEHGKTHTFRASVQADALLEKFKGNKAAMISAAIVEYLSERKG